jgi:hypothetical protein
MQYSNTTQENEINKSEDRSRTQAGINPNQQTETNDTLDWN